jgi:hypothetical protein
LFYEAVDQAILPPLEALGLEARAAWQARQQAGAVAWSAVLSCGP